MRFRFASSLASLLHPSFILSLARSLRIHQRHSPEALSWSLSLPVPGPGPAPLTILRLSVCPHVRVPVCVRLCPRVSVRAAKGAALQAGDRGRTPLMVAAAFGHAPLVQWLITEARRSRAAAERRS